MKDVIDELNKRREDARLGGGIKRIEAQHSKGMLKSSSHHRVSFKLE